MVEMVPYKMDDEEYQYSSDDEDKDGVGQGGVSLLQEQMAAVSVSQTSSKVDYTLAHNDELWALKKQYNNYPPPNVQKQWALDHGIEYLKVQKKMGEMNRPCNLLPAIAAGKTNPTDPTIPRYQPVLGYQAAMPMMLAHRPKPAPAASALTQSVTSIRTMSQLAAAPSITTTRHKIILNVNHKRTLDHDDSSDNDEEPSAKRTRKLEAEVNFLDIQEKRIYKKERELGEEEEIITAQEQGLKKRKSVIQKQRGVLKIKLKGVEELRERKERML